jgi:type I restriction enzyme S subunit
MSLASSKNWKTVRLGDLGKVITGKTPSKDNPQDWGGQIPFITPTDIKEENIFCEPSRYLSSEGISKLKNLVIPEKSICYTCIASIGKMCLTSTPSITNQQINSIIVDNLKTDYRFVYYLLKFVTPELMSITGGTMTSIINKTQFENFKIKIPESKDDQKEIADILGSLDDKIELLRSENKTLESIAQTLFKEWFVDFKFPGSNGKKVDSKLGEIPDGWRIGKLGEFIKVRGGLSYDGNLISKKGTPMLTMGFVSGNKRFEWSGLRFYTGKYKDQNKVKAGSLVIATRDVTQDRILIGSPALVPKILGSSDIIVATNLYIAENINYLSNKFLYWLMRTPQYRERIVGACKGTTIVMITRDSIFDYEFVLPPKEIAERFDEINDKIFNKLELIDIEIQTLSKLRDDLLNKIFS